jgi:hypothetical protein
MGRILWLASYPKSGNTWVRVFLANLLRGEGGAWDINRLGDATLAEPGTAGFALLDPRPWQQWGDADIARLRPRVQERIASTGPGVVPVKTHSAFVKVGGIPTINMAVTAGAIYVVRNPLDVAVSYAHHQGMAVDAIIELMAASMFRTPTNGTNVYEVMGSWSEHVASWTAVPSPQVHVMRYEDMLDDAPAAFAALVRFMRVKAEPETVARAVANAGFDRLVEAEGRAGFVERTPAQQRFFRAGRAGQWRDNLSRDQVAAVVAAHRAQMERFGYVPEGY